HHIGLEFNEKDEVHKIIINNKEKHPDAHLIEVVNADLDHALEINGYELDDDTEIQHFKVDDKAFFVEDERETQIAPYDRQFARSEEHTSELQSRFDLVCRLLLEKKKTTTYNRERRNTTTRTRRR